MKRFVRIALFLLIVIGLGVVVWERREGAPNGHGETQTARRGGPGGSGGAPGGGRGGRRGGPGDAPIAVLVSPVERKDVPVTLEAVGTTQALNTVTVRAQVDGRLVEIAFKDGQDVRKGDVLARIDPVIYQSQYDQAVAKKAQDEAQLANARIDLQRYTTLASGNYGSKQQADTQRATVAQLEAQVKSDQAAIDNARAYLDYTTIRAPIDGRLGIRLVDQGNIVKAGDTTGIVVITQVKPITVFFTLPQQQLAQVNAAMGQRRLKVEALAADNRTVVDTGVVEAIDNQVDQTTGTVKVRAAFPNATLQLWPGQFVNVRLFVDVLKNAIVVPASSIQRGPNGPFVYTVSPDDKAVLKLVTVSSQDESQAVIAGGVAPPERVITTGFARLTDGNAVRVSTPDAGAAEPGANEGQPARPPQASTGGPADPGAQSDHKGTRPGETGRPANEEQRPPGERRQRRPRPDGESSPR